MAALFVYGTLCHLPLLAAVLGRAPDVATATLTDHAVFWADGQNFPLIVSQPGAVAQGLLITGLRAQDQARLDHYEGPYGYETATVEVQSNGVRSALVYMPAPGLWQAGPVWRLADWAAIWGDLVTETAADVMALFPGPVPAHRRMPMLVRGASRLRARTDPAPATLRRAAAVSDVQITARRQPYANFFAIEEYDLAFRRFDGGFSPSVNRAVFISGDAVTVLPYDPVRDRVLLVEQFRAGPFGRGDPQPWLLEAIAGRIDPGESPEHAARREAEEEAGLHLADLIPVANYYVTPGAKTEYLYSYVALTDLPDGSAILGGEASEAEDIKGHLIGFDALMDLVTSGEVANAPLILSALWLQRERARLRRA